MEFRKGLSLLMVVVMVSTMLQMAPVNAAQGTGGTLLYDLFAGSTEVSTETVDSTVTGNSTITENSTEPAPAAEITLKDWKYNAENDIFTVNYRVTNCVYVKIYMGEKLAEEKYMDSGVEEYTYEHDCKELKENQTYTLTIEPYNEDDIKGTEASVPFYIPYRKAVLESIDVEYSLETKYLDFEWEGQNIGYVDIYQWDELIAKGVELPYLRLKKALKVDTKYTYTVVPYNRNGEKGTEKICELEVGDYVAGISGLTVEYDESAKQIQMEWDEFDEYTKYVEISLNDEELEEKFTGTSYVVNCELQPGAAYVVSLVPYNYKEVAGTTEEVNVSFGEFETPDDLEVTRIDVPVQNLAGNYTGFSRPSVQLSWTAQKGAVYEIYRAKQDKPKAYTYLATITSNIDGDYIYTDAKAGFGTYYYKIRRVIVEDAYIAQGLCTALSDAESISILVPKPTVASQLNGDGTITLTMESGREYVSGYDIYRKSGVGSYELLATVTEDEYIDKSVEIGNTYHYKVKAYYYDISSGKKVEGKYSKALKVKNIIGSIEVEAVAISQDTVRLTWAEAANAQGYEVYYRTGTQGDSYALWKTTDELTVTRKLRKSGTFYFMIKAYRTVNGRKYFSSAEVVVEMGFTAPGGLKVISTSYARDKTTKVLSQKDTISWNRVYGAEGYILEVYDTATGQYKRVKKIGNPKTTTYTITNQVTASPQTLKYRISAYVDETVKEGGTVEITPMLGTVEKVKVKAVQSGSKVKVSWNKVLGAERYRVYRSNGRTMLLVGETAASSILDGGLDVGITYKYYVKAVNDTQKISSANSEPVNFTTYKSEISGLKAVNSAAGTVKLTWTADRNVKKYIIYYKSSKSGKYQKLAEVNSRTRSYIHKNQTRGNTCYYKVVARQKNCGGILVESAGTSVNVKITK